MESAMAILQSLSSFTNQLKEVNASAPDRSGGIRRWRTECARHEIGREHAGEPDQDLQRHVGSEDALKDPAPLRACAAVQPLVSASVMSSILHENVKR
jgi:hypothetical protein